MDPLVFTPYLRPQVWGGRGLSEEFGKRLPLIGLFGESWELSGHPHHVSVVAEGPFTGASLNELCVYQRAEMFGLDAPDFPSFPLLIKLLDCQSLLSVQVHPNDADAQKLLDEPNGKTEAWMVLKSHPDSIIYAGLKPGVTAADLRQAIESGNVQNTLHSFHPEVGDCLFVPAGLVHAVGGGVLMAEVQQTSDATFRLFDWNRLDPQTNEPRILHIEKGLAAVDFSLGPGKVLERTLLEGVSPGVVGDRLVHCDYFHLDSFEFHESTILTPFLPCPVGELTIWLVVAGTMLLEGERYVREFSTGDAVLTPASIPPLAWRRSNNYAPAGLLRIRLPIDRSKTSSAPATARPE